MRRTPQACSRSTTKSPTFMSRLRIGGNRCVCVGQTLLLEFGPEIGRGLSLQRVVVLLDLLSATGSHDQSDRDVGCRRELNRGGAQINAVPGGDRSEFLPLLDHHCRNLEVLLTVARAAGDEAGVERGTDNERDVFLS